MRTAQPVYPTWDDDGSQPVDAPAAEPTWDDDGSQPVKAEGLHSDGAQVLFSMRLCSCLHWLMKSQTEGMLLWALPVRHDISWHGNWGHGDSSSSRSLSVSGAGYVFEIRDLLYCFVALSVFVILYVSVCPFVLFSSALCF